MSDYVLGWFMGFFDLLGLQVMAAVLAVLAWRRRRRRRGPAGLADLMTGLGEPAPAAPGHRFEFSLPLAETNLSEWPPTPPAR